MAWLTLVISVLTVISTGLAGTWAIGRSFNPLKRVAAVASSVAHTDLESGKVELTQRVSPHDAIPGTEVGNVGQALNALIDNVDSALKVRERSQGRCANSWPTPPMSCVPRCRRSAATPSCWPPPSTSPMTGGARSIGCWSKVHA